MDHLQNKGEMCLSLGLDLGTTTLSAVVADLNTGEILETHTIENNVWLESAVPGAREQDAGRTIEKMMALVEETTGKYGEICAIGLSGQMHGIVYVDAQGKAVSPLYTWQDSRANLPTDNGMTFCAWLQNLTGCDVKPGYGLATHFYNTKNGLVPENAVTFCTIADYAAMCLTGRRTPLLHTSQAASLGLFDMSANDFDANAVAAAGMGLQLPAVTGKSVPVGEYRGIPVAVALGDNQAGVFGSLREENGSVLVNFGTGSQISVVADEGKNNGGVECRPYVEGRCLLVGSALCGGKAYAMLENFFRLYMRAAGAGNEKQYEVLNRLAQEGLQKPETLAVDTRFCGTRQEPAVRGGVFGIGEENFTPEDLVCGVLRGMADELLELYRAMDAGAVKTVVASGNGVRKNPALREVLRRRFGAPNKLTANTEEAAFGAALFAALAGGLKTLDEVKQCIRYL